MIDAPSFSLCSSRSGFLAIAVFFFFCVCVCGGSRPLLEIYSTSLHGAERERDGRATIAGS
jgi:hypothetical protein